MALHLYCIVDAGHAPPSPLEGVDGAAVEAFAAGSLGCWGSRHTRRPESVPAALRRHNDVIAAAMDERRTPVPVRFGQWFADVAEAAAAVEAEQPLWRSLLDRFAGHAEYGVRIALPQTVDTARDVHPAEVTSGKAYMAALARREAHAAERRRTADDFAAWIGSRVGGLAARSHVDPVSGGDLAIAHLVAWRDADAYRTALHAARAERPDVRIATSGPWPPYAFVQRDP